MSELFIANDPRWLSGGADANRPVSYDADLDPLGADRPRVTTKWLLEHEKDRLANGVEAALAHAGQNIHRGKAGYHYRPELNLFLEDDGWPSIGVELETIRRDTPKSSREAMHSRLVSNWFHFEDDGSLRSTGDGHECITEPLPSRVYRDVRTWIGLQNILVPYAYSWNTPATGLHVHVGLARFGNIPAEAFRAVPEFVRTDPYSRSLRNLARFLMFYVQTNIADEALLSDVFLRPRGGYCGRCTTSGTTVLAERMTSRDTIATVLHALAFNFNEMISRCRALESNLQRRPNPEGIANGVCAGGIVSERPGTASGHGAEMNTDHFATFEFRRGKGTLNGVSIHRMVEYCALVEKFIEKMMMEPDMVPSNHNFRLFLADNTTSAALRETALKTITTANAKG